MNDTQREMIMNFQCPGCSADCVSCSNCDFDDLGNGMFRCSNHSAGTIMGGVGKIALGLPKGFNKVGAVGNNLTEFSTNVRLVENPESTQYNFFNMPIWAMEEDGYLFVRCYCPRINFGYVDVIKGGTIEEVCPKAVNIKEAYDDFD